MAARQGGSHLNAFRTLLRDGWVVGIACAAALAYTTINVLDQVLGVVFSIVDGLPVALYAEDDDLGGFSPRDFYSYDVVINGHIVLLEPLLRSLALFAFAVVTSEFALHAKRSSADDESAQ